MSLYAVLKGADEPNLISEKNTHYVVWNTGQVQVATYDEVAKRWLFRTTGAAITPAGCGVIHSEVLKRFGQIGDFAPAAIRAFQLHIRHARHRWCVTVGSARKARGLREAILEGWVKACRDELI